MNSIPTFVCDQIRPNLTYPDELIVSFQCTCGRRHAHGWGRSARRDIPQHRIAHCPNDGYPNGYYIVITKEKS